MQKLSNGEERNGCSVNVKGNVCMAWKG